MVERTRARANVRGLGKPDACKLDYALRVEDMIEGDVLVTSGTDGVFPRGLPVGKVTKLERNQHGLFQEARVVPAVDVTRLEEVLVVTAWERTAEILPAAYVPGKPREASRPRRLRPPPRRAPVRRPPVGGRRLVVGAAPRRLRRLPRPPRRERGRLGRAAGIGYVLDLVTDSPKGLMTFLAVLLFVVVRAVNAGLDVRGRGGFALLSERGALVLSLGALVLTRLTSPAESAPGLGARAAHAPRGGPHRRSPPALLYSGSAASTACSTARSTGSSGDRSMSSSPQRARSGAEGLPAAARLGDGARRPTFLTLVGRLYHLQILRGDEYKEKAEENFVKEIRQPADRGHVLDRNRRILVDSRPSYDVTLTPYFCGKQCDEVLARLATMLSMTPDEMERARAARLSARKLERFRPFTVKVDIAREELDLFLAHQMDLPGVDVQAIPHRNYRYGGLGGHLIGYMNEAGPDELKRLNEEVQRSETGQGPYLPGDYTGRRGLERRFERQLRGIDGKERVPVDAKGRRKDDADDLIPKDQRVVPACRATTSSSPSTGACRSSRRQTFPATAGVVLAMDARPGSSSRSSTGRRIRTRCRAHHRARSSRRSPRSAPARAVPRVQQHYHPGSTFKALTSIAALEEGVYHPARPSLPGPFRMGSHRWRCDKDSGHGYVDFTHALGASCNVFFYEAGARLGADAIAKWAPVRPRGTDPASTSRARCRASFPTSPGTIAHLGRLPARHAREPRHRPGRRERDAGASSSSTARSRPASSGSRRSSSRVEDADGKVLQEFAPQERARPEDRSRRATTVMKGLLAAVNEPFGTAYWQRPKESPSRARPARRRS